MANQALTLEEALDILEINNIESLTENDIEKYRKKAYIRWHPDKVAHTKDSKKIELYTAKTQLIEPSVELIKKYLKGEYSPNQKFEDADTSYDYQDPLDILRKNAAMMQEEISKVWNRVKETQFMKTEEDVVLSEGHKIKDLLNDDLKSDIVPAGVTMIFLGFAVAIIVTIIGLIWSIFSERNGHIIEGIATYGFLLHFLICILSILPMSRFWLPNFLSQFFDWYFNVVGSLSEGESNFWMIVTAIGLIAGYLIKYVIIYPIYLIAIAIIGEKVIRRVVKKQIFYANLADWYIEQLMQTKVQSLTDEQLYHLSHAYSNLTKVSI